MPDFEREIEALPFEGACDFHCHCDFSMDAVGSLAEYCEAALVRNLAELCFTTHFDTNYKVDYSDNYIRVNGKKLKATIENLQPYVDAVHKISEEFYALGLSVKLGLEFGWYEGCEELAVKTKERYKFDYFLCGMHQMDDMNFWSHGEHPGAFDKYSLDEFTERYFKQAAVAASSGLFDNLAHLDYYRRRAIAHYGDKAKTCHENYLADLFEALKISGTGIEINTAAMRHGLDSYYPQMSIINAAKKAGVKVVKIGSDAHRPEDVGYDFEIANILIPSTISCSED